MIHSTRNPSRWTFRLPVIGFHSHLCEFTCSVGYLVYSTSYKSRLTSLHLLPLMYSWSFEMQEIMFVMKCVKHPSDNLYATELYSYLWNALPPIDTSKFYSSIKIQIVNFLQDLFILNFIPLPLPLLLLLLYPSHVLHMSFKRRESNSTIYTRLHLTVLSLNTRNWCQLTFPTLISFCHHCCKVSNNNNNNNLITKSMLILTLSIGVKSCNILLYTFLLS